MARGSTFALLLLTAPLASSRTILAQTATNAPGVSTDQDSVAAVPARSLPIFLTLGAGYGLRFDDCTLCTSPENTESFTAHLGVGRYLVGGLGIGLDASVWRRSHPGPLTEADSTGAPGAIPLVNMLGNGSVSFSYQLWHVYVRGGGGLAWGSQDLEWAPPEGDTVVTNASGWGVGYSVGAGITLPVHPMVSLAFFANWNAGRYDLTAPHGILARHARHEQLEMGVGISLR